MDNQIANILIVDDRKENLLALEAVLTSPKYRLVKAFSGEEALKCVLREEFAVIILDVQMPGLNGFETAKMIRERKKSKDIPIIFITALSQTFENVLQGYSVGAIDYILKPFDPLIIESKVEGFVSIYLNQKKVEKQAEIIANRTKELEEAYIKLQKSEEMLESLVIERTNQLSVTNEKLQIEIEEKQRALWKLSESEEKYRQLVEEAPAAILVIKLHSEEGFFINETGVKLLKANSKEEVMKLRIADLVHPIDLDKVKRSIADIGNGDYDYEPIECKLICLNGDMIQVELKIIPFMYGGESSFHIMIHDLTELMQSREFIQQTEKLTVVGELAAGIAHEIRNPLTSLRGFTQILDDRLDSSHEFVEIMLSEIDRINMIVSELLLLAKPKKHDFKDVEIEKLLYSTITLMNAQANLYGVKITLNHCMEINEFVIYGLENKIKQVFINLLKNAIESMPNGGEITIDISKIGKHIEIKITDEGSGIPSEILKKLGQPFLTTKETGTGLGLMVCFSIIESHKGTMVIDSIEEKGTTINIKLPLFKPVKSEVRSSLPI